MSPPPYRPCLRTKAAALLLLLVVGFAGAKAFDDEIVQGPYEVQKTSMAPEDWFGGHTFRIYTPNGTKAEEKFPAVIFAHGLCGPEEDYEGILRVIASHGYIILANAEQEYCGRASVSAFFQFLTNDPFPDLRRAADGSVMIDNLREEVDFVLSKNESFPYDEGAGIALVGHSMGGAAVLDLAASLGSSKPIRGVAVIAPWNGITDAATPSSVAGNIKSPVLLFCSKMDQLCPCSGEVGAATGAGQNWASDFLFNTIFAGRTKDVSAPFLRERKRTKGTAAQDRDLTRTTSFLFPSFLSSSCKSGLAAWTPSLTPQRPGAA